MVTMMEVSNTILIQIFVNNNMFPTHYLQDLTLSCWATCSCSWGLMWKVSARQKLVIFTSIRFFLILWNENPSHQYPSHLSCSYTRPRSQNNNNNNKSEQIKSIKKERRWYRNIKTDNRTEQQVTWVVPTSACSHTFLPSSTVHPHAPPGRSSNYQEKQKKTGK